MSFLGPLMGGAGAAGAASAAAPAAATGLGHLIGADPSRISQIAGQIGGGMNRIAAAGGAAPGYEAPQAPAVNNHMQLLDPEVLHSLIRQFGGYSR